MSNTIQGGNPSKLDRPKAIKVLSVATAISLADNGVHLHVATDALVHTLPAIGDTTAPAGTRFRFVNTGADGNNTVTISPAAADAIFGSIANAAADSVASGVDDKDIVNTKATANKGDYIELVSDGTSGWYISAGVGIWASEA